MIKPRPLVSVASVLAALLALAACGGILGTDFDQVSAAPADAANDGEATVQASDSGDGDASDSGGGDAADSGNVDLTDSGDVDVTDSGNGGPVDSGGGDAGDSGAGDASDSGVGDANDSGGSDADAAPPLFPTTWSVIYPSAKDVAVGATDDDIWLLDGTPLSDGNFTAMQWNASSASFVSSTTTGWTLDVTDLGPCITKKQEWVWVSQTPTELTQLAGGVALDIGSNGTDVWVISNGPVTGPTNDYTVYRWTGLFTGNPFVAEPAAYGIHLDVAPDGSAWLVLDAGGILHVSPVNDAGNYQSVTIPLDGKAIDIAAGADGSVYAIATLTGGSVELFKYSPSEDKFDAILPIDGQRISAGPSRIVVLLADGRVVESP